MLEQTEYQNVLLKMRARPRYFVWSIVSLLLITGTGHSLPLLGAPPPPPSAPSITGASYTVSWEHSDDPDTVSSQLEEKPPGGQWTTIGTTSLDQSSVDVTRGPGTYQYRTTEWRRFNLSPHEPDVGQISSTAITVEVVNHSGPAPVPGTADAQAQYTYDVRIGDLNYDSLQDIFVSRTSGGEPLDGSIDDIVLQKSSNGSYSVVVPSAAQLANAISWPETAIAVVLDDFNADGFVDVMLKGISNTIAGAFDQIIFAPGQIYLARPLGIRQIDADFKQFVEDLTNWEVDENYFSDRAVVVAGGYWRWRLHCELYWWYEYPQWYCYYRRQWVDTSYTTYPDVNVDAVYVWETWQDFDKGFGSYQALVSGVESEIGVEVGSQEICDDVDVNNEEVPSEHACKAITISAALEAVRRRLADLAADPDIQFGRETGLVYVTGHGLFGFKVYHTALEYRDPQSGVAETISAEAMDGKLVSSPDRKADSPFLNKKIAVVNSVLPPSLYFQSLLQADDNYRDCLEYDYFPFGEDASYDKYNSNGFIAGIVAATHGAFDFSISAYTGMDNFADGDNPVPAVEFSGNAPACP